VLAGLGREIAVEAAVLLADGLEKVRMQVEVIV
jgi:hypothetical protein